MYNRIVATLLACCVIAPAFGDEQVLLESKEAKITDRDFEARIAAIPEKDRAEVLASRDRIRKILEGLLVDKTLAARARSAGIDGEPIFGREMELESDNFLAQELLKRAVARITYPDFDARAKELYLVNPKKYTAPERVHASHLLVEVDQNRSAEDALKRIQEIRAQAIAGKPFAELVEEYSDDAATKPTKGDLGFFEAKDMVPPFSRVAFSMSKPEEISEPVRTEFGYHLIQFHEKEPEKLRPFEDVKAQIVQGLRDKFLADFRKKMISEIVSDPALKLNSEAVDRYKTTLPEVQVEQSK